MDMLIAVLLFAAGVVLVIKGGDWFVDAASWIAKAAKIPPFIVGATIVSFATTMPEMIVSVMAALEGKNDMAVGNAVGSVTANTGLIMAIAFVFMTVIAPRKKFIRQFVILVLVEVVLWLGSLTGTVPIWVSAILSAIFLGSMYINVTDAKKDRTDIEPVAISRKAVSFNIVMFVIGAAAIVLGSNLLIRGGSSIAEALGVPERIIAITMVAIGTSLPELVTTLTAIRKKESHMSIGNIIGANIIDISLILPVCSFVSGGTFTVADVCMRIDMPAALIITLIAVVPMIIRQKASRIQGLIMIVAYIGYIVISM